MVILYSKSSLKFLAKQNRQIVDRIRAAVERLTMTPPEGDIKKLKGYDELMRLRVGSYRIIFHYSKDGEIEILNVDEIGNRGDIYK